MLVLVRFKHWKLCGAHTEGFNEATLWLYVRTSSYGNSLEVLWHHYYELIIVIDD